MMQDDDNPPDLRPPVPGLPRGTLPPAGKIVREVFAGLEMLAKELWLPALPLIAGKWGLLEPKAAGDAFIAAMSFVLGGHFGLRRPKGPEER